MSVSHLARELAGVGVNVLLWAPDGSASSSPLLGDAELLDRRSGPLDWIMREVGPSLDLVHDNGIWLPHNHAIARAARRLDLPRVVTPRGMLEPWSLSYRRIKKKMAWALYQRQDLDAADVVHATATSEAENIDRLRLKPPVVVVSNGVDLPPKQNAPRKLIGPRRRALFVGRIHPKKGLPMLLEAWARERPESWELLIAGPSESGHDRELQRQIETLGLRDCISLRGPAYGEEKNHLYYSADLFILPTHSENFGISVAEALAHGIPAITTMGAPWSLLHEEECGWWVPASTSGLQRGLGLATHASREQLHAMGLRGRSIMERRFAWRQIAMDVRECIYEPLLS